MKQKSKILVIVGPTASGKTFLSIQLAQKFNGEIISADSRQVYRGLDLGSGKVTKEEMQGVSHHLLDVADPNEIYTAHNFVSDGRKAISDIVSRKKLPIIVGGTFLYIEALIGKVILPETPPNPLLREKLEGLDTNTLFAFLKAEDPNYAEIVDAKNPRRLIRALEIVDALGHVPKIDQEPLYDTLTLGIKISKEKLTENIHLRLLDRLEKGMIDEVKQLHANGLPYARMEDLGLEYRYIARYLQGKITHDTMCSEIEAKSRQFAKRQMTWLKRDANIVWVESQDSDEIDNVVTKFLT